MNDYGESRWNSLSSLLCKFGVGWLALAEEGLKGFEGKTQPIVLGRERPEASAAVDLVASNVLGGRELVKESSHRGKGFGVGWFEEVQDCG